MKRSKIVKRKRSIRLDELDADKRYQGSKKEYEADLAELQLRMLAIQQAYYHQRRRAVIVFEGWDASGKGGSIRRMTQRLDPRGLSVHAIGAPDHNEQGRHYLHRFWSRLPAPGTLGIFDRSWYGRVLVERVEGFAKKPAWKRAFKEINEFERMLLDDGVRVLKIFIHISKDEQLKRFIKRLNDPYKQWKLTDDDLRNRSRWDDYVVAIEDMLDRTDTKGARWHVVEGNHKWHARLRTLELVSEALANGVDIKAPKIEPEQLLKWLNELQGSPKNGE